MIANYVFDSVPADAFAVADGALEECLVSVSGDDVATMELVYARRRSRPATTATRTSTRCSSTTASTLDDTVVTIPRAAIECVRRLRELAGDRLLVLAADKAHSTEESLALPLRARAQPPRRRFSLMVNFHALGWYARPPRRRGARTAATGTRRSTSARLLFGAPPGGYAETRLAYDDAIERFGPDDLSILTEGVERAAAQLSVAELVALLRLSGWDAFTLLGVAGALREQAADADPAAQEDLRHALFETYDRHFAVPGDDDLPFAIGLLLYELRGLRGRDRVLRGLARAARPRPGDRAQHRALRIPAAPLDEAGRDLRDRLVEDLEAEAQLLVGRGQRRRDPERAAQRGQLDDVHVQAELEAARGDGRAQLRRALPWSRGRARSPGPA